MKKLAGHLLFRIFITYLVTALLIVAVLFGAARMLRPEKGLPPFIVTHLLNYTSLIQAQWGQPINLLRKQQFAEKYELNIICENDENWSRIQLNHRHQMSGLSWGDSDRSFFVMNENLRPRCFWEIEKRALPPLMFFPIFSAVAFILFILMMSFLSIHWMMKPVQYLLSGASQLAEGNLSFRLPRQRGVLKMITEHFNQIAQRLETLVQSKENLLRDVSHELKSPLARMSVAVSLLPDQELKVHLQNDIQTMDQLIQKILHSYRYQSGQMKMQRSHFHIKDLMDELVLKYQGENIDFKVQVQEKLEVSLDRLEFEKVFRNLIENALTHNQQIKKVIDIKIKLENNLLIIIVADNGIGIAKENLVQIFEPFYRVDQSRTPGHSNFGLGLSIVHAIVKAHGGNVQVTSHVGIGTEFILRIPQSN